MYVIIAAIQIKDGHKDEFIEALLDNAKGAANDEPGCLRFDVIQDSADANRLWLYEVYKDEAAFQAHSRTPHYQKMHETVADWREERPAGAGRGSHNIWPPDDQWK